MAKGAAGNKVRTLVCEGCGGTVTKRMPPGRHYCSLGCYRHLPKPGRRTGSMLPCAWCNRDFYVHANRRDARFCTTRCRDEWQGRNKTEHTCAICETIFKWSPSRTASGRYNVTYCSLACRDADPERAAMLLAMNTAQQLRRTTKAEAAGYALLDGLGVAYERQALFMGKFTPDAIIPAAKLVVQFDGDYWHDRAGTSKEPRVLRRVALDQSQDAYIRACGWRVVRLWESDLRTDPPGCVQDSMPALASSAST